ncbi:MAG: helix-turn-helix transcriptional regulator [Chloroflexota bacterium]
MLKVPEDMAARFPDQTHSYPEAALIQYRPSERMLAAPVLVTCPTFVLVNAGVKQLKPQAGPEFLIAPADSLLAMRSGTHLMSEFHGEIEAYHSLIFSVNRTFLRKAVGASKQTAAGPRVAVSFPSSHARQLFRALPGALAQALPEIEREFKLRELLIALMGDQAVRQLVLRETADWGNSDEERLVSIVTTHCLSPLQVPDLAQLCAMSLSSFKRQFQRTYGTSPAKWLSEQRLEHARTLVLNSALSVSEICDASGYRDVSSFVRAFRRSYGQTPTALRLNP